MPDYTIIQTMQDQIWQENHTTGLCQMPDLYTQAMDAATNIQWDHRDQPEPGEIKIITDLTRELLNIRISKIMSLAQEDRPNLENMLPEERKMYKGIEYEIIHTRNEIMDGIRWQPE